MPTAPFPSPPPSLNCHRGLLHPGCHRRPEGPHLEENITRWWVERSWEGRPWGGAGSRWRRAAAMEVFNGGDKKMTDENGKSRDSWQREKKNEWYRAWWQDSWNRLITRVMKTWRGSERAATLRGNRASSGECSSKMWSQWNHTDRSLKFYIQIHM